MSPSAHGFKVSDPLGPLVHISSPASCTSTFYQSGQCHTLGADWVEALIQFSIPPPPPPHSRLPPCRDEFLLRPVVHVITVVTAHWSVIHFSDLCIPITKWRLLSGLCVCPVRAANAKMRRGVGSNEGQLASRARCPPSPVPAPACVCRSVRHVDIVLLNPVLKWRPDTLTIFCERDLWSFFQLQSTGGRRRGEIRVSPLFTF